MTATTGTGVERALGVIRAARGEIERERRLPDEVVAAVRGTGLNRMLLPAALGGTQAAVADVLDLTEAISAVDGSAGWCAIIGAASNVFAGLLPERAARLIFADPDQGNATMFAPAGRLAGSGDSRRLAGRWPFTSNVLHSAWAGLGAVLDEQPVPRVAFVRVADLTVEDTWDSAGLRGTGSHHVRAADLDVPLDHCCTFADPPWPEGTLWRLPIYSVLLPALSTVPLGIARGALDEVAHQAVHGRQARRGQVTDDPIAMADLARADTRLRAARAALREAVDRAHDLAERCQPVPRELQARTYLACLHATDTAVEVAGVAHQIAGAAAAFTGDPVLRALQDVQAGRQHLLFSHRYLGELGKALLGLPASAPPYLA
jgi:indole-3-acetate monooxygenase